MRGVHTKEEVFMKKLAVWLMLAVMCFAVLTAGCGGGSDSPAPEQSESLNDNTGEYDPNEGGKGTSGEPIDLSTIKADYTAKNGEVLKGILRANVKVSIADGATVTLRDAHINGVNKLDCMWAGLTCEGNAALILEGTNYVKGFHWYYSGIYVPKDKTLTIKGSGSLDTSSNGGGAGIGGGRLRDCGNIVIEDGTITATGGKWAAGIGGGYYGDCGNIVVDGGTINSTGGAWAAGIGGGRYGKCGNITITNNITQITAATVTATKDTDAPHSIGAGEGRSCGTVTMGGAATGPIAQSPFLYTGTIDLSTITELYTAQNGELLTGKLGRQVKISVADGAAITLHDVKIEGYNWASTMWAGLTCKGDATLILSGNNYVQRANYMYPAIYVPVSHTLTITGTGALTANASAHTPPNDGSFSAGIGGGAYDSCGNIVIEGGTIEAIGGYYAAGIGGGNFGHCGYITIKDTVTKVTATAGEDAPYSIGKGASSECGTVTIGDKEGPRSDNPCIYP